MATWVKICGITRLEDARAAFDNGADAIGLNFWPGSRRYIERERARDIVAKLPKAGTVYGVFVDVPREEIEHTVVEVGLGGVQIHGHEPASASEGWSVPVLRGVAATSREAVEQALAERRGYRVLVDYAGGGGSGRTIDEGVLDGIDLRDAIVAGGLTPDNVAATVARFAPFGVDTAGGVESAPGVKDARRIEAFLRAARR